MWEYYQQFYIEQRFGYAYIVTFFGFIVFSILLLNERPFSKRGWCVKLLHIAVSYFVMLLASGIYYILFHEVDNMHMILMLLFLVVYAAFISRYRPATRIVMSAVFYSMTMMGLSISEASGAILRSRGVNIPFGLDLTTIIIVAFMVLTLCFLRSFTTESHSYVPGFVAVLITVVCVVSCGVQIAHHMMDTSRNYNIIVCIGFCMIELLAYYMFYVISREYSRNLELVAISNKARAERDMYRITEITYKELGMMRHELKNYIAYMQQLLAGEEYAALAAFFENELENVMELAEYVNSGNSAIDTILNFEIKKAKTYGAKMEVNVAVPSTLPFRDNDLCSILCNLIDNALESCMRDGCDEPVVWVQIWQEQGYLFLQVKNQVDARIPNAERLKLKTAKANPHAHGYGTKIVDIISQRYHGCAQYEIEDGKFTASVMLALTQK